MHPQIEVRPGVHQQLYGVAFPCSSLSVVILVLPGPLGLPFLWRETIHFHNCEKQGQVAGQRKEVMGVGSVLFEPCLYPTERKVLPSRGFGSCYLLLTLRTVCRLQCKKKGKRKNGEIRHLLSEL